MTVTTYGCRLYGGRGEGFSLALDTVREKLKRIREYRGRSQEDFARLLGIGQQAYSKKERGDSDGFSPEDFAKILQDTQIDARWLFGQMEGEIEAADLRLRPAPEEQTDMISFMREFREIRQNTASRDALAARLQSDFELRDCVEKIVAHRGLLGRVAGYIDALVEAQRAGAPGELSAGSKAAG